MTSLKLALSPDTHAVTVEATELDSGLLVYELPENVDTNYDTRFYRWRIGHHGGQAIAIADTEIQAIRGAVAIADVTDWRADTTTVRAALAALSQKDREAMRARLRGRRCYPAGY